MSNEPLLNLELPGFKKVKSGKVREVFDLGERLLFVATDRISAFDCVMPNGIPRKGEVLTRISYFWFNRTAETVPNHLASRPGDPLPAGLEKFSGVLAGRSMVVKKARPLAIECVVRGYLAGSGWKEYQRQGTVCGIPLPAGLRESDKLPEPIFTPSTKAQAGHDENISFAQTVALIGEDLAKRLRDLTLEIYSRAARYAESRGIVIADTKFEFGFVDGTLVLGDEVLTPDSSRFWPADTYRAGGAQFSFDKQFVRDYLESIHWNKQPPAPPLPQEVAAKTSEKYLQAYQALTGHQL